MCSVEELFSLVDNSWLKSLQCDPEWEKHTPNRSSREVKSGHFVLVEPTPLPDPHLIGVSSHLLAEMNVNEEECKSSEQFLKFVSGGGLPDQSPQPTSWATPYALSIYGKPFTSNCPFGTGNGYGDGRAISIGEFLLPNGQRWELQLKGGGRTPFCRGGDGRAVLRSSVREFLVSEAMHCLHVSTTRAISLVVSGSEIVKRPWYNGQTPAITDAQRREIAHLPGPYQQYILTMLQERMKEPNVMIDNPAAITCRVAPSFTRVGHVQLFERRVNDDPTRMGELKQLVEHLIFREYPEVHHSSQTFQQKVVAMLECSSQQIAKLTADWIRVGFCQGNFNSDNCLVAGRTMDYGPFGFIERYEPYWNMWTGGGEHYSFMNQPMAGTFNFRDFAKAVLPLLEGEERQRAKVIAGEHENAAKKALDRVWRQKLGLSDTVDLGTLVDDLLAFLTQAEADWTIFWRQLAEYPEKFPTKDDHPSDDESFLMPTRDVWYKPLVCKLVSQFTEWLNKWLDMIREDAKLSGRSMTEISASMRLVSPMYVPREWMLVKAYSDAEQKNYDTFHELFQLFSNPYERQSEELEAKYYQKAPYQVYEGVGVGGTSFMT